MQNHYAGFQAYSRGDVIKIPTSNKPFLSAITGYRWLDSLPVLSWEAFDFDSIRNVFIHYSEAHRLYRW